MPRARSVRRSMRFCPVSQTFGESCRRARNGARPPSAFARSRALRLKDFPVDRSVAPVSDFTGGATAAQRPCRGFSAIASRVIRHTRNQADLDGTSQLSPYLHFGQMSVHAVAVAVKDADAPAADRRAFLEEFIVRRELAINFVRYNPTMTVSSRANRGPTGRCAFIRGTHGNMFTAKRSWRTPKPTTRCGTRRKNRWC